MATGLGNANAPYAGSEANLTTLSNEIVKANAGLNPSLGWKNTVAGQANVDGTETWGGRAFTSSIDSAARWVWHSSNGDLDPTIPGFNHNEWLVFRIQVGAVPEPSSFGLVGVAACLVALRRRRA